VLRVYAAITTGIDRTGHSRFDHPSRQTDGDPKPLRAPPFPKLNRTDVLGSLIHEYAA
jgi:hypothetical protein